MTRWIGVAPFAASVFLVALLISAAAIRHGLVGDDALRLWAGASLAADGQVPVGRIVAGYPTLPFLSSSLIAWLAPGGTPAPALVSAGLLAIIAAFCCGSLRRAGFSAVASCAFTASIVFHPALLRALIVGPADICFAGFLLMLCLALYDLRARSGTSEVMAVGLSLMGLAFSHPAGAAVAFAAIPFLAFAVQPTLVANSAMNIVIALVFPTLFAIVAFSYISWIFPGDGWTFLAAPTESLSLWAAAETHLLGNGMTNLLVVEAALAMAAAIAVGAPVAIAAGALIYRRRPLVIPPLVLLAAALAATVLSLVSGLFGDPAPIVVAAPVLAAAALLRVPPLRERGSRIAMLLAVGWLCGFVGIALIDPVAVNRLEAVIERNGGERGDALAAGGISAPRNGVLADIDNAPAFLLGRGSARGIFGPQSEAFTLAMLFARIDTPFVAVPDPQSRVGASDRLNKAFPALFHDGLPGYRVVYQNSTWRLFEKIKETGEFKSLGFNIYDRIHE